MKNDGGTDPVHEKLMDKWWRQMGEQAIEGTERQTQRQEHIQPLVKVTQSGSIAHFVACHT